MAATEEKNQNAEKTGVPDPRAIIECLLFSTGDPLSVKKMSRVLPDIQAKEIRRMVRELQKEYNQQNRGFQIVELAGGFQMATRRELAPYILKLNRHKKRSPLSVPALETLAIIAYRQPIIRAEIEAIRGVDSSGVIRSLVEAGLVRMVGRKEVVGHPPLYGTTEEFLKVFGLKKLSDLPSIRELREQFEKSREPDNDQK